MTQNSDFTFKISLSVLDHLGRHLYRSFATVLGEAISNAWDADAHNVWIYVDKDSGSFFIKDDGVGMNADDFQNKFLKVGYSKRKLGNRSLGGRYFIGRKGIGKLALLSCAKKISIISKVENGTYVGGIIDNNGLDKAIIREMEADDYPLSVPDLKDFKSYVKKHKHGTIIKFQGFHEGIKSSLRFLRKIIALYFKFSLIEDSFKIYLNDERITYNDLTELANSTQFVWVINKLKDPYVGEIEKGVCFRKKKATAMIGGIKGFIASVEVPRNLNIFTTDERVGVDLFVNGRLREANILRHIPTAGVPESYLYGQLHYDDLDKGIDRFTSSREGIIADDPKYKAFLIILRKKLLQIISEWDDLRRKNRDDGDPGGRKLTRRERKSEELFNAVSEDYKLPKRSKGKEQGDKWVDELSLDARFNFSSYAECFVSENLLRKYIKAKRIKLRPDDLQVSDDWKNKEKVSKEKANISIDIRKVQNNLSYLDMDRLAILVDRSPDPLKAAGISRDACEYKPIRDAVAHTAQLTDGAKKKLTSIYENVKARLKTLLSETGSKPSATKKVKG